MGLPLLRGFNCDADKLCRAEISYIKLKGFQARLGAVLVLLAGTAAASDGAD